MPLKAPFLLLGLQPGDVGHAEISGGTLTVGELRVGGRDTIPVGINGAGPNGGGTGTFIQSGGTVNVNLFRLRTSR